MPAPVHVPLDTHGPTTDCLGLAEVAQMLRSGETTSEAIVSGCLDRIAAYDGSGPALHAMRHLAPDAPARARALDRELGRQGPRSPLHGIPVILKDNIDCEGLPTTAGSIFLQGHRPSASASTVAALHAAGAVIIGKSGCSEFAVTTRTSLGPSPRNPHDPARTPSSSSGGAAVAVAAGFAPLALGTDTGGSIRGPAAANAVVGLKPTHGAVPLDGVVPLASSLDVVGPLSRDVAGAAALFAAIVPEPRKDGVWRPASVAGRRIGLARQFLGHESSVDLAVSRALDALVDAGVVVTDVAFPDWLLEGKQSLYLLLRRVEFARQIGGYLAGTGPDYPKTIDDLIAAARDFAASVIPGGRSNPERWAQFEEERDAAASQEEAYRTALDVELPRIRAAVMSMLRDGRLDAIVFPTLPEGLPRTDELGVSPYGRHNPANIANLSGLPELSVPVADRGSLPVGLSLLGLPGRETRLFDLGQTLDPLGRALRIPATTPPLQH